MQSTEEINELILNAVNSICDDSQVKSLIKSSIKHELDFWNRHIPNSQIIECYEVLVEKALKENE